jgi:hypothetical protein
VTSPFFLRDNGVVKTPTGILVVMLAFGLAVEASAQVAPPVPPPAVEPSQAVATPAVPVDFVFPSGAGLLIFHVTPTKVADFDAVLARLTDALSKVESVGRQTQAANWSIYKSAEKPAETVTYLFLFDPAVATANYDPLLVLAETLPAEVQPLYDRMKGAVVRIERMGLTKIR